MTIKALFHDNIRKLYALNFLSGIVFWYPIEKLFLQHIHIGPFGVSINAVVFLTIMVTFDIPAGVLADNWKRKYTLLIALGSLTAASIIGGLSHNLFEYLVATALVGGFVVLTSGTFQAMMYDSLLDIGQQKHYDKHQGRAYALFLSGLGVSSVCGGYIAQWHGYRATYFVTALTLGIAFLAALTLAEPQSHKPTVDRKLREHVRVSIRQIRASQLLLQLSLLVASASVLNSTENEYSGLLFIALGFTAIPMGYVTALKWLFSSLGQVVAPKIGRASLRLAPLFFMCFTLFSLIHNRWSLLFFYAACLLFSIIFNQAESAIQDSTPSEIRATTLSVLTFSSNILLIPLSLVFGSIAQHSTIFNAYLMVSVFGLIYLLSWLLHGRQVLRPVYHQIPQSTHLPTIESEIG